MASQCLRPSLRDGISLHRYPGTSCLATISLSLRDKSRSPIEGLTDLSKPAGNVIFGLLLRRIGEYLPGLTELDQVAEIKERCQIRTARSLLHVVGHDNDRELLFKLVN